jgi:organic hydroperoxide reductase OsmC/OhrA
MRRRLAQGSCPEDLAVTKFSALIEWRNAGPDFVRGHYGRGHRGSFSGGAVVAASASPHSVPRRWVDEAAVDPEEALVAAASSCHMMFFINLESKEGLVVECYRDEAEGFMGPDAQGRIAMTRITLRPEITFAGRRPDADELVALHHAAHERCYVASSLRAEIIVETEAGGSVARAAPADG